MRRRRRRRRIRRIIPTIMIIILRIVRRKRTIIMAIAMVLAIRQLRNMETTHKNTSNNEHGQAKASTNANTNVQQR